MPCGRHATTPTHFHALGLHPCTACSLLICKHRKSICNLQAPVSESQAPFEYQAPASVSPTAWSGWMWGTATVARQSLNPIMVTSQPGWNGPITQLFAPAASIPHPANINLHEPTYVLIGGLCACILAMVVCLVACRRHMACCLAICIPLVVLGHEGASLGIGKLGVYLFFFQYLCFLCLMPAVSSWLTSSLILVWAFTVRCIQGMRCMACHIPATFLLFPPVFLAANWMHYGHSTTLHALGCLIQEQAKTVLFFALIMYGHRYLQRWASNQMWHRPSFLRASSLVNMAKPGLVLLLISVHANFVHAMPMHENLGKATSQISLAVGTAACLATAAVAGRNALDDLADVVSDEDEQYEEQDDQQQRKRKCTRSQRKAGKRGKGTSQQRSTGSPGDAR